MPKTPPNSDVEIDFHRHPFEEAAIHVETLQDAQPAKIVLWPNKALSTRCEPITKVGPQERHLASVLIKTMHANRGVGLAANQIGVCKRMLVYDLADIMDEPKVIINPVIAQSYGDVTMLEESCLSAPGLSLTTERQFKVRITGLDEWGEPVEVEAEGHLAACLQHEIDHLDGVMFFERAKSQGAANLAMRKAKKRAKKASRQAKRKKA